MEELLTEELNIPELPPALESTETVLKAIELPTLELLAEEPVTDAPPPHPVPVGFA